MTLRHVQRGDFITAAGWNEMIDRLNMSAEGMPPVLVSSDITISNMLSFDFPAGQVVPIAGMRHASDGPDACLQHFLEFGFQLEGGYSSARFYAVTKEAVPHNRTGDWRHNPSGPAEVPFRMVAAMVYTKSNGTISNAQVIPSPDSAEYFASAAGGDFHVVAQSNAASVNFGDYTYKRFCYLTHSYGRLKVTYYDSSGTAHYDVPVSKLVFPNAFVGSQDDGGDPTILTIRLR